LLGDFLHTIDRQVKKHLETSRLTDFVNTKSKKKARNL